METLQIKAMRRLALGKGGARKERQAGLLPANVYSGGKEATTFAFEPTEFRHMGVRRSLHNALVQLDLSDVGGQSTLAMVKEVQRHPVRPELLHVDFLAVAPETEVTVKVPVVLEGTPVGVKMGGRLKRHMRITTLRCAAKDIPQFVPVDISGVKATEKLSLSSVTPPEGTTLVYRYDEAVVSVTGVSTEDEEGEEETAEV